jgi:formate hydrogenlyase subunit 3/multisubunit Na+/H+ antiporter MnhD subunit
VIKSRHFQDWVNLVLAVLLFISPWLFAFSVDRAASTNAWVSGVIVGALAVAALTAFAAWEEWIEMLVGFWVVISPWTLAFAADRAATWSHVIIGLLVIAFAASELYQVKHPPQATTIASR